MAQEQNQFENNTSDHEKVLGDHFWNDFLKMLPQKAPPIDVMEDHENGYIFVQLPGIKRKEQINVSIQGQQLTIEGIIPNPQKEHNIKVIQQERQLGPFKRTIIVPFSFQLNQIKAKYEDGVLKLTIQKSNKQVQPIPFTITTE
ncbi:MULTISPECIES: Hsp20/alpha crystallin family protein [Bacillus]|uniref:Hsp20/alpha crystallin family protein n=1 Tax=Bacillus TaxID=1386 RepID=UPI00031724BC|nr:MULTISPECIES: Hsp20/alpha crystallin family protein [Bacillus]